MDLHLDDRLLHGRILHGWGERLGTRRYVLISERLADPVLRRSFQLAAEMAGASLRCLLPEDLGAGPVHLPRDEFWLTDSAVTALRLREAGWSFERLVVIALRDDEGVRLADDLCVGDVSRRALGRLETAGVVVEHRAFPADEGRAIDLSSGAEQD